MANTNLAYRLDAYPSYDPRYEDQRESARDLRAERTGAPAQKPSSLLVTAAVMAAIILCVVAALSFARIALTGATVSTLIESDTLSGQIESARTTGVSLEMEQSVLSNMYAIEAAAKRLGMYEADSVGTIALPPDAVVVNESGALSLSGSVKSVSGIQG